LAHGGNTTGYALYLRSGQLFFTVRENKKLFTISSPEKCGDQFKVEARLRSGGEMVLAINGSTAAQGKAAGLLPVQPQEHFCLGFDDEQPVGDYPAESRFQGQITWLNISTDEL
ncbi:MAG TPA: hypothetical protein VNZ22_14570, partial [Bacillota bacterium]|nr:hypothetical protein [Bacillota bacterium]